MALLADLLVYRPILAQNAMLQYVSYNIYKIMQLCIGELMYYNDEGKCYT